MVASKSRRKPQFIIKSQADATSDGATTDAAAITIASKKSKSCYSRIPSVKNSTISNRICTGYAAADNRVDAADDESTQQS